MGLYGSDPHDISDEYEVHTWGEIDDVVLNFFFQK